MLGGDVEMITEKNSSIFLNKLKKGYSLDLVKQTVPSKHTLTQCWTTIHDAGPTLAQHWVNVSCQLGSALPTSAKVVYK